MAGKPTYEELVQRVRELEEEAVEKQQIEKKLRESEERFRLPCPRCVDAAKIFLYSYGPL